MCFSVIIPVYNRPQEIHDLLVSLTKQEYKDFEVIIVEDGSSLTSKNIVEEFTSRLTIQYFFIDNVGQGFARNFGMQNAKGNYFVLFDSDCLIPPHYFSVLNSAIINRSLDAHGGPDAAEVNFSPFQKAINYSMTSFLTTGGIRGKLKNKSSFQARGFNMGLSQQAFLESNGFIDPNRGEDIELSLRLKKLGYKLELLEDAYVYHKRKNTWWSFFRQSFDFGRNRINVSRYHSDAVKPVHLLPVGFLLFCMLVVTSGIFGLWFFKWGLAILLLWMLLIFLHASWINKTTWVGFLSLFTSLGQLNFYGAGLLYEFVKKSTKS